MVTSRSTLRQDEIFHVENRSELVARNDKTLESCKHARDTSMRGFVAQ